uniref:Uncharacterized protein n=1 Tax=Arundo donax TaxID=35708 RepID=A0A0A9FCT8_ARUDO
MPYCQPGRSRRSCRPSERAQRLRRGKEERALHLQACRIRLRQLSCAVLSTLYPLS